MAAARWVLVGLIAVTGCDSPVESQREAEKWAELNIRNYEFVYFVGCFCGFNGPNPAKLTVRDGVVVKVEPIGNSPLPPTTPAAATYPTVDSLFARLERTKSSNPAKLKVEYDDTYHFPALISIDYSERTADDEFVYTAQSFAPSFTTTSSR